MTKWCLLLAVATVMTLPSRAADNLKLNEHLDYSSDSHDGPLITADHLEDGAATGKPTYLIIYGEGCFNSKRQARRTVELYEKYKDRVQFVVVDMDRQQLRSAGRSGEAVLQGIHSARYRSKSRRQDRLQRLG